MASNGTFHVITGGIAKFRRFLGSILASRLWLVARDALIMQLSIQQTRARVCVCVCVRVGVCVCVYVPTPACSISSAAFFLVASTQVFSWPSFILKGSSTSLRIWLASFFRFFLLLALPSAYRLFSKRSSVCFGDRGRSRGCSC